jgi:opacity protein-like surface antigen
MKTSAQVAQLAAAVVLLAAAESAWAQSWAGPYVGGQIGYGAQPDRDSKVVRFDTNLDHDFRDTVTTAAGANAFSPGFCGGAALTPTPAGGCSGDRDGADAGVWGGYDWQVGHFVIGAVGELSFTDQVDSVSAFSTTPAFYAFTRELNWLSGMRGRAGYGAGRFLIYGSGGAALGDVDHSFTTSNMVNTFVPAGDRSVWGYQLGAGFDMRLAARLRLGVEYLFTSLNDRDEFTVRVQGPAPATNAFIRTNPAGTDLRRSDQFEFQNVRLTASYRF